MKRLLAAAACATFAASASAQSIADARAGVALQTTPATGAPTDTARGLVALLPPPILRLPSLSTDHRRAIAPLASAAVPGVGQWLLGQDRFLGYVAVEALAWWRYRTDRREAADEGERYKEIARRVARSQFTSSPRDTVWAYYEQMRDYIESGQYSLASTGPVQPETDPSTFNGSRWLLAQATNADPAQALAEYERTAVKPDFRWSWRNAQFQYDIFKRFTDKRNDANHAATRDLLLIGANHVLSMVDAFAAMRLQVRAEIGGTTRIGASLAW